ncbi:MAG: hypothetical protein ACREA9_08010 [Pyrinomonadaceae bacterium]
MLKALLLRLRAAQRLGEFKQATQAGMSPEDARAASDQIYPPTPDDLEFEAALRNGTVEPLPLASALALLYPVTATLYIASTPARPAEIAGYGLANLAYLLAAAGVVKGTFLAFGLRKRTHVFAVASACFIVGVVLSNVRT